MELRPQGINVVVVEPGNVRTDISKHRFSLPSAAPYYHQFYKPAKDVIEKTVENDEPPEVIAKLVYKVVMKRSPKVRYPAGKGSRSISLIISPLSI